MRRPLVGLTLVVVVVLVGFGGTDQSRANAKSPQALAVYAAETAKHVVIAADRLETALIAARAGASVANWCGTVAWR